MLSQVCGWPRRRVCQTTQKTTAESGDKKEQKKEIYQGGARMIDHVLECVQSDTFCGAGLRKDLSVSLNHISCIAHVKFVV